MIVGTWVGADWEVGELYTASADEAVPVLPDVTIKMSYEFSAAERVACPGAAASAARRCVRLEMRSEPDSAAMRKTISELLSKVAPEARAQVAASARCGARQRDADRRSSRLRPYRLELVKSIAIASEATATQPGSRRLESIDGWCGTLTRRDRRAIAAADKRRGV